MYWSRTEVLHVLLHALLQRGIRILVEAMRLDHVVEAVGHEHIPT